MRMKEDEKKHIISLSQVSPLGFSLHHIIPPSLSLSSLPYLVLERRKWEGLMAKPRDSDTTKWREGRELEACQLSPFHLFSFHLSILFHLFASLGIDGSERE